MLQLDDQIESTAAAQELVDAFGRDKTLPEWAQPPVVVVTSDVTRWGDLQGVTGWITCEPEFLGCTLSNAHLAFASFGAPMLLTCLSIEDAVPFLGSSTHPTRLIEAHWRSEDGQFFFDREEDEAIVLEANTRLAFVFLEGTQARASRAVSESLSNLSGCTTERTLIIDFMGRAALNDQAALVLFLCTDISHVNGTTYEDHNQDR